MFWVQNVCLGLAKSGQGRVLPQAIGCLRLVRILCRRSGGVAFTPRLLSLCFLCVLCVAGVCVCNKATDKRVGLFNSKVSVCHTEHVVSLYIFTMGRKLPLCFVISAIYKYTYRYLRSVRYRFLYRN